MKMEDTLFERLQQRLKTGIEPNLCTGELKCQKSNEVHCVSSGSDIDDDITLEECVDFIEQQENQIYTQLKSKLHEGNKNIVDGNALRSVSNSNIKSPEILRKGSEIYHNLLENLHETETFEELKCRKSNEVRCVSSGSDIDDDITLEECADFIEQKENQIYTQVKSKLHEGNQKIVDGNVLRSVSNSNIKSSEILRKGIEISYNLLENVHETETFEEISKLPPPAGHLEKISVEDAVFSMNVLKRKRAKLTAEEKKNIKEQKEMEKLERKKKREREKMEKELEKERVRAVKRAETMAARSERKEECMERMLAVIDPCLVQENGGGDILKDLQDIFVRYELKSLPIVSSIGWMRENVEYKVDENNKFEKYTNYVEEAHIIHKISAHELATRVECQNKNLNEGEDTLVGLLKLLKASFSHKKITIVVVGMDAYHRLVKAKQNEQFRKQAVNGDLANVKRKKKDLLVPVIAKEELDKHLVKLQVQTDIAFRFCEDMPEFSRLISSFTKAMAEAPFKKTDSSNLHFSATADKLSFKVSKDGHGISQVWNQQLQQFYGVRNDISVAITQVYPTPMSLMKAYMDLSVSEGEKLLQDIEIRRGVGVLQTKRRIGPELSKKMHKLFTSLDGSEPLAK